MAERYDPRRQMAPEHKPISLELVENSRNNPASRSFVEAMTKRLDGNDRARMAILGVQALQQMDPRDFALYYNTGDIFSEDPLARMAIETTFMIVDSARRTKQMIITPNIEGILATPLDMVSTQDRLRAVGPHVHVVETAATMLGLDGIVVPEYDSTSGSFSKTDPAWGEVVPGVVAQFDFHNRHNGMLGMGFRQANVSLLIGHPSQER